MYTSVKLVDGAREMDLLNRSDIAKLELDIPLPAVREEVEDRTDDDGSDDYTAYHGSRAVSVGLRSIDQGVDAVVAELGAFMHPRSRPYLRVAHADWTQERQIRLRVAQGSAPQAGPLYPYARDVQAQWVAPDGVWTTVNETEFVIAADTATSGRSYEAATPRVYPTSASTGLMQHDNPGTTSSHFVARLYGPCQGPRLTNETTGETVSFGDGLVLGLGEYIEIDSQRRSAFLNSDPDATRLDLLDFLSSRWWRLAPGVNQVRYHPVSGVGIGCTASVFYRPAWLWL